MKRLLFRQFGRPLDVIEWEDFELAPLQEGEVRLKMLAAPINPADLNFIEGTYGIKPELPAVPGIEGCAEVMESRDPRYDAGDLAIFLKRSQTWASHVQVRGDDLFKLPRGIDPLQAAMLKVNPATARVLLTGFRQPEEGAWVVQNAGNSGVGRCVIQLAKTLGVRTLSFVRRAELIPELKALGGDEVLIDGEEGLTEAKALIGESGATLAFNAVGGDSSLRLMNLLRRGAIHITYGAMGRRPVTIPNGLLIFKDLQFRGMWLTRWLDETASEEVTGIYQRLAHLALKGELVQPVDSTYSLKQFPESLTRVAEPGRGGKVLFVP
jgi:trans-2-enoyl-CoA reductase